MKAEPTPFKTAPELLAECIAIMQERATMYEAHDIPVEGERNMETIVRVYQLVSNKHALDSAEDGWLFMSCLKLVRYGRARKLAVKLDSAKDGANYLVLAAEQAGYDEHTAKREAPESAHKAGCMCSECGRQPGQA